MGPNGNVCSRTLKSSVGPDVSTSARVASGRRVGYEVGKKKDILETRSSLMPPNPDEVRRVTCMRNWRLCCTSAHTRGPGYREAEEGDPWELQMLWVWLLSPASEKSLQQSCSKVWGCCIAWHACTDLSNGKKKIRRKEGRKERRANLEAHSWSTVVCGNITHHHWEGQGVRFLSCYCPDTDVCGPGGRQLCSRRSSGQAPGMSLLLRALGSCPPPKSECGTITSACGLQKGRGVSGRK